MAARFQCTNIAITVSPIWTKFGKNHLLCFRHQTFEYECQMAIRRHFNSKTVITVAYIVPAVSVLRTYNKTAHINAQKTKS